MFITSRVTSLFRMAQFIDYGDNCSDGPPSTIGDYDIEDDFINDAVSDTSSLPLFIPNPESPRVSVERYHSSVRSTSPTEQPYGLSRRGSRYPSASSDEIPLLVARHQRQRRRVESPYGQGPRYPRHGRTPSTQQREHSSSSSNQDSEGSFVRLRSVSTLRSVQDVLDPREPRNGDENPFDIPNHLRGGELAGLGVPGKRLGTGKPRWSARYFMFTTSQSGYDWPYQSLINICEALGAKHRISRELHADGGYHFHAFVDFERKFEFENPHKFCVGEPSGRPRGECPVKTHCNILPITRTPFNTFDYVKKYGDVVSENCERPRARGPNVTRDDMWTGSLAQSNKKEFLEDVRKHSPRDAVLFDKQITAYAHKVYDQPQPQMPTIEEDGIYIHWERYPEIRRWVIENLSDPIPRIRATTRGVSYPAETEEADQAWLNAHRPNGKRPRRPKSLIVYGKTRLGKTLFATNLGPHVHWQRDFNLRKLLNMGVDAIDYAIFDDIDWKNPALKGEGFKAWLGGNRSFDVSDKFDRKFTLEWGKPCIVLTNRDPYAGLCPDDTEWLEDNCIYVTLGPRDPDRSNAIGSSDVHEEL